ncbi:MAG TPA: hypothetical protein VIL46_13380 [Gemmataceae bacterium]
MRRFWILTGVVALAGLADQGCGPSRPNLRPQQAEEYVLPPAEEARWSEPPKYPEERSPLRPLKKEKGGPAVMPGGLGGPGGLGPGPGFGP